MTFKYSLLVRGELIRFMRQAPEKAAHYLVSAAKSEGRRLMKVMRAYILSMGRGTWPKFREITKILREREGYREIAKVVRYNVFWRGHDLIIMTGVIPVPLRAKPPSWQIIGYSERFTRGVTFRVTRRFQKKLAVKLRALGKSEEYIALHIPHVGKHRIPARPFVEPIERAERDNVINNIMELTLYRLKTGKKLRR